MENSKYVVNRDDIYVGKVVRTDRIYRYCSNSDMIKSGKIDAASWKSYRSMLFVPNEEKFANDLLYNSPNYPILNVTDDKVCLDLKDSNIVIKNAYNLSKLLEYFGYEKDLTYEDIIRIRDMFFTGEFAKDNCQLFGRKEIMAEDLTFYINDHKVTELWELEKRRRQFRKEQKAGHRIFTDIGESPLPREYWDVLDKMGDNTLMDVLKGRSHKMNAFAPDRHEGSIKKLIRV